MEYKSKDRPLLYFMVFIILWNSCESVSREEKMQKEIEQLKVEIQKLK